MYSEIYKGKEISLNMLQKSIIDRYKSKLSQINLYIEKEDKLYKELEKLKEDEEKADNLSDDYRARTGETNYDLLGDANYKYDLLNRKRKEITRLIKEYSKYLDNFDESDKEYFNEKDLLKEKYMYSIDVICLEYQDTIKPKKKSLSSKSIKKEVKKEELEEKKVVKTKLEIKQEKIRKKIIELHKKIPKKIESIYPVVLKIKTRLKK
jgi:hypothetical protein